MPTRDGTDEPLPIYDNLSLDYSEHHGGVRVEIVEMPWLTAVGRSHEEAYAALSDLLGLVGVLVEYT
jgi:hypothetical protein